MKRLAWLSVLVFVVATAGCQQRGSWHVSPTGKPDGDGSKGHPWDLKTALAQPAAVKPGDTIWLHGGTYKVEGELKSTLCGEPNRPIIVRRALGERATLDTGKSNENRVYIKGQYAWYWGFEVMSSATGERVAEHTWQAKRGVGVQLSNSEPNIPDCPGLKLINLVIHDVQASGVEFWSHAIEGEVYGCVIYDNGCNDHQHGIYTQNDTAIKRITDCLIFDNSGWGIHAYGTEHAHLNNFHIEGNILWNNGIIYKEYNRNIHIGGGNVAENPVVVRNFSYFDPNNDPNHGISADMAFDKGVKNAVIKDNWFSAGAAKEYALMLQDGEPNAISGNAFYGQVTGLKTEQFPQNMYYGKERPKGTFVLMRPNRYESGRANIGVFNWDNEPVVRVDVSCILKRGDKYIVKDAQNFWGKCVAEGVYKGGMMDLPMDLKETSALIGGPNIGYPNNLRQVRPVPHTPREFGAFVLIKQ